MISIAREIGSVQFPEFRPERFYMIPFFKADGLPEAMSRYQPVVDVMLKDVDTPLPLSIMVDASVVPAGKSHRVPGRHIDGYWDLSSWKAAAGHGGGHATQHAKNLSSITRDQLMAIQSEMLAHGKPPGASAKNWPCRVADFSFPEALILAQSAEGSCAWTGEFDDAIFDVGGGADHVDVSHMERIQPKANHAYAGNVTMLHESLPLPANTPRTLIRISAPGWSPN